jgi:hypothetical protein
MKTLPQVIARANILAMVLATLGAAAPARAAPEAADTAAPAVENPNRVALVLGLGTPWGELGLTYQRRVGQKLALEAGVGLGATGVQLAALPKLSFGSGRARFYIEAGPTLTLGGQESTGVWAAGEIGFEASLGRVTLGLGAGASVLAAGKVKSPICFDACSTVGPGVISPDIRLTVGFNF